MRTKISFLNVAKAIGSFTLLVTCARGDTIYSTLGPQPYSSNGFSYTVGWEYSVPAAAGGGIGIAAPFSFGSSAYQLDSVTLDIGLAITEHSPNLQIWDLRR